VCEITTKLAAGYFQFAMLLQVYPALRIGAEIARQAQGRIGSDATTLAHDALTRAGVTPMASASAVLEKPSGTMNSSRRISLG